MQLSKTTLVGIVVVLVALAGLGWYVARDLRPGSIVENDAATGSSTTRTIGGITYEGDGDIVVEQVPVEDAGSAPSLDRSVSIPATFGAEAALAMREEFGKLTSGIKKDPGDTNLWLALGLRRQEVADYEGAREVYEYVARLIPGDSTAYSNLGNLYHFYLKDFPKSEQYFKKAIELDPKHAIFYANLHDLYRYSYKQTTTAAADILKQGIKESPESIDLYVALGAYYKTQGKKADAKSYYEQALDLAVAANNTALREAIGRELANL